MPFFYSISEGISMGVISYVVLNLLTGKAKGRISIPDVCTGGTVRTEIPVPVKISSIQDSHKKASAQIGTCSFPIFAEGFFFICLQVPG